ncbi:MAG: DegV family protein [Eubacteriales bacterium]|nr:DegV family protein [Eubacteriales bacterium]
MFMIGDDRVALVTDTSCDLSEEQLQAYDIRLVSLRVATSEGEFRDRLEIDQDILYDLLKRELPKTSLPLPEDVSALYRQLKAEGCTRVVHMTISSNLSGTYNMVRLIAEETEGLQVDVVDTRTLSCGLGLLVLEAAESLAKGMSVEDTLARVEHLRATQLGAFVIRTLEFLRKGGRIGLVEGVVGSLLQIKPVIYVNDDGVYNTLVKARGFSNALSAMNDECFKRFQGRKVRIAIVHGAAYEEAVKLRDRFLEKLDVVSSFISPVSPALAIHTGPGLLGAIVQYAD